LEAIMADRVTAPLFEGENPATETIDRNDPRAQRIAEILRTAETASATPAAAPAEKPRCGIPPFLDINAGELASYAAQVRYLAVAITSLEAGAPADRLERENCAMTLLNIIEDISGRAEAAAESLQHALEKAASATAAG
jgi:hypothetical protein